MTKSNFEELMSLRNAPKENPPQETDKEKMLKKVDKKIGIALDNLKNVKTSYDKAYYNGLIDGYRDYIAFVEEEL